ncbi:MotE family protein [Sulfurimonas microaerophilic]|uniref:MotE family protein n=1 Tax=Sulfurimonas microaerophilic TaxID=3058392 RepID=UPI00271493EF|nr:PDP protein [Sulfurimonas sp. hsl 1-7]
MRFLLVLSICYTFIFGLETSDRLFECTEIFKQRKSELLVELERIDEQKQALQSLKTATEALLKEKETKLNQQEEEVNNRLDEIKKREKSIKTMLDRNEKALAELKSIKLGKVSQTFAKMKPAAAANILGDMQKGEAVKILQSLKPQILGKILSKMEAKKASELTQLLAE